MPPCLCAFVPLCLLPSCTKAPSFSVADVQMTEQSEAGYVLTFTLEGTNPNKAPLPLREVHYSLSLDGRRVFEGTRSAQATIPSRGKQTITLPVSIPNDDATKAGVGPPAPGAPGAPDSTWAGPDKAKYRIGGTIVYVIPGSIAELLFDSDIRKPKVDFSESGVFEFTGGAAPAATK